MWNLKIIDTSKPLYLAIAEALEKDIRAGYLRPGELLPTHRALAKKVGVTLNTATHAYQEAERRGLISAVVGRGTFVNSDLGGNPALIDTESRNNQVIEMGLGFPLYAVEPGLAQVIERVIAKNDLRNFMKYSPPQGLESHRRAGAAWMRRFGLNVQADQVIVTAGAQHAINCIFTSLFEPGDRIAADYLSYPGLKTAARRCGIKLEGVLLDDEGLLPEELDALCLRHKIKGIYSVACLQNPTNACISPARCRDLAEVIKKHQLLLIEDDLYSFLPDSPPGALSALLPENSIYIAGLSKAFYAGLRVAFLAVPQHCYNRLAQGVLDTIWVAPPLSVEIACESIACGAADKVIRQRKREIDKRAALLPEALRSCAYKYARHSMFVWLTLPQAWTAPAFEAAASARGVNVVTADKFIIGSYPLPNCIRLSLTGANSYREFKKGLEILSELLTGTPLAHHELG